MHLKSHPANMALVAALARSAGRAAVTAATAAATAAAAAAAPRPSVAAVDPACLGSTYTPRRCSSSHSCQDSGSSNSSGKNNGSSSSCESSSSNSSSSSNPIDSVKLIKDEVVYRGWRTIKKRTVCFPNGSKHSFDVSDAPPAVLCLPFFSKTKTFTVLREYCPGPQKGLYCVVCGLFEAKHRSIEHCVACEAEEEAGVRGGRLVPVMNNTSLLLPGAKYTAQPFIPYLIIDGEKVSSGRLAADEDELLESHEVSLEEALGLVFGGHMTSTGAMMLLLGVKKLQQLQLL
ncbi:NUDIX domain-containing protein, putative [Eimeria tenella]|uniref:NUDIX domain-containing protein, putative n=1 Tax=Eimeria tenella TaxID=5802 RepID=U6LAU1_EIMTE|nr:NUDIX domain-containing protein, putative [Eimeria tenella]CDJ44880.1 NUDIX domain-containing protein, putative [Eimeria tenella]|eukprot:XP_013235627.1 NUDIX domain-containing protein, putative [Eimeria tenella]